MLDSDNGVCCHTPLHSLHQGSPTTARATDLTGEAIPLGRKTHFANNEKVIIYEKSIDLVDCNISRKNNITLDVWPSNCCAITYMVHSQKIESPGLYELDRTAMSNPNGLLSQKLCHYLNPGCTLNDILMSSEHSMAYFDLSNLSLT